ncbi:MAG: GDSL-type esterase/lipase family protein [Mobilicoccus sp.]|nr:GDSL-type esterase/lipase family protein [Mobilicoccus sp.]
MNPRSPLVAAIALLCVILLLVGTFMGVIGAFAAPAKAAAPTSTASVSSVAPAVAAAPRPYLVLGDSLSAGYQPDRGDDPRGGYAARVAEGMAQRGQALRITNLACTGESTSTMRDGARCSYRQGSQQAAALAFLRANPDTALVTVSLGANDVLRCAGASATADAADAVDTRCVQQRVRALRPELARQLTELRRAAPQARVVVLDYYDPSQAGYLVDRRTRSVGNLASMVRTQVNMAVRGAARDAGVRVAYVTEPFDDRWTRSVATDEYGILPIRVARICAWTWMCHRTDIHPNDEGYRVIGDAVLTSLRRS